MRALAILLVAAAAIAAGTSSSAAVPAGAAAPAAVGNATPLPHLAQGNEYGGYTYGFGWSWGQDYKPACPLNYHYSCWSDPYGYRHCGCILNWW